MGWFGRQASGQPTFFQILKVRKIKLFYCIADVAKYLKKKKSHFLFLHGIFSK